MSLDFVYNSSQYDPEKEYNAPIPMGNHRVRILEVEEKSGDSKFKSGNEGFKITFDVSGYAGHLWYYIVLIKDDVERTNQKIGEFFDSFGIVDNNLNNYASWVGKVGAVRVKHDEYEGKPQAKVSYCIKRQEQAELPPWKEPVRKSENSTPAPDGFSEMNDVPDPF